MTELTQIVSKVSGVSASDILRKTRKRNIAEARFVLWYFLHRKYTYSHIGKTMGWNHASVRHGVERVKEMVSIRDPVLTRMVSKVNDAINTNIYKGIYMK